MPRFRGPLPRRTVLRGVGTAVALPFLQAMLPFSASASARLPRRTPRLLAIEMVHGAAGSTAYGRARNLWSPAAEGSSFALTPSLTSLAPFRDALTIVSNTELRPAETLAPAEDGDAVDHARSSAAFLTGAHPLRSASGEIRAGRSIDQIYAGAIAGRTPIASLALSLEEVREIPDPLWPVGYDPAYRHSISWADERTPIMPQASPGLLFARLFGHPPGARRNGRSLLDSATDDARRLNADMAAEDRHRLAAHLDDIRALELRIGDFERAGAPNVPFSDHVQILGELVRLAFAADLTRVCTIKLGMDRSQRVFPESGVETPFHTASHHRQDPDRIEAYARLNAFHVRQIAGLLDRFARTDDEGDSLLRRSLILYGSPMGDSHVHGHDFLPIFLAGQADGAARGGQHVACAPGTPFANLLLTILRRLDLPIERLGDSQGEIAI